MQQNIDKQWYRSTFANIAEQPWTEMEATKREINFLIDILDLKGGESILDLACGFGRHTIELAKKGFNVVGVDISEDLIEAAKRKAYREGVNMDFICADVRDIAFNENFDVVLNLCDGAIGYLETATENYKVFETIAHSLKPKGKNIMHIPNIDYMRQNCPLKTWNIGEKMVELLEHDWDNDEQIMFTTSYNIKYGCILQEPKPVKSYQQVYSLEDLHFVLSQLNMCILNTYGDFNRDVLPSADDDYLIIVSSKA